MKNPVKKFEIEITPVGIWLTELDAIGDTTDKAKCYSLNELENDILWFTKQIQIDFNF